MRRMVSKAEWYTDVVVDALVAVVVSVSFVVFVAVFAVHFLEK